MASNFSTIPIRWLLTVDSEIRLLRMSLFSFKTHSVQEKIIAKLVNDKVNFTGKTDVALIAS